MITALLSTAGCRWEIRSLQDDGKKVLQNLIRRYYLTKHQRYLPCGSGEIWGEEEPKKSQQRRMWAGFLDWRLQKVGEKISGVKVLSSAKAAKIMIEISRHQQEHEMFQRSIQEHPLAGTAKLWQPCSRPSGCSPDWEMLKTLVDALHPHKADMHKVTCAESYCGRIRVVGDIVSRGMFGLGTR